MILLHTMKRLAHQSQYFIRNPRLISSLLTRTTIQRADIVYDLGAGSGVISSVLAHHCKQVIAVEAEPRTAELLRKNMAKYPNVEVYHGDILAMELPETPYKVFANIPFHLSSAIIRKLTETAHPPDAVYLIVQKQFANKLVADSTHFTSQLGAMIGPLFTARVRKKLLRTDFWPHPAVDTVFLELTRRKKPAIPLERMASYRQFITDCFSDPKVFATMPQEVAGLPTAIKPSQLTIDQWLVLFSIQRYY